MWVILAAAPAWAFEVKKTSNGEPIRWGAGSVDVELALDETPVGVDPAAAAQAARAAFATYEQVLADMAPGVQVEIDALAGAAPEPSATDGKNLVRWVSVGWDEDYDPTALAITLTTYDTKSGRITDADIVVNASRYRWIAGEDMSLCRGAFDLQDVLTHEVGHLFGLAHDKTDQEATMWASAGSCETKKRDLDPSDLAGMEYLYQEMGPATDPSVLGCAVAVGRPPRTRGNGLVGLVGLLLAAFGLVAARRHAQRQAGSQGRWHGHWHGRGRTALWALLVPAVLALGASDAHATTVRRLALDEMGRAATLVAQGTVISTQSVRVGGRVYTDTRLAVSECWKGVCDQVLVIRQLGGEVDGVGLSVEGLAPLPARGEVVLFLRARRDGALAPVGMAQGAFTVERDAGRKARAAVRDVRGLSFAGEGGRVDAGGVERVSLETLRQAARAGGEGTGTP
jgi:matrixin